MDETYRSYSSVTIVDIRNAKTTVTIVMADALFVAADNCRDFNGMQQPPRSDIVARPNSIRRLTYAFCNLLDDARSSE